MDNLKVKALEYFAAKPHDDKKAKLYLGEVYKEIHQVLVDVDSYDAISSVFDVLEKFISHVAEDAINDLECFWNKLHEGDALIITDNYFGKYHTKERLYSKIVSLLGRLRYLEQEKVVAVLLRFWKEEESARNEIEKVFKELAGFNLHAVSKIGFNPQLNLLDVIIRLSGDERAELFPVVVSVLNQFLSTDIEGHDWDYRTVTIKSMAIPGSEEIERLRSETISLLISMYEVSISLEDKKELLNAMNNACHIWSRAEVSDEAKLIVENNTVSVLDFWASLVVKDRLELVQKIEHDAYWNYYHASSQAVESAALRVETAIETNKEYQIYRDLVGFEGIFGRWEDERDQRVDYDGQKKVRDHRIRTHIEDVSEDNLQEWLSRIELYLETDSRDLATFPELFRFAEAISTRFPKEVLSRFEKSPALAKSAVPIFRGLWNSSIKDDFADDIKKWIGESKYLWEISALFVTVDEVDESLIDKYVDKAIGVEDLQSLNSFVRILDVRRDVLSQDRINDLFSRVFSFFNEKQDSLWVNNVWFSRKGESFIASLSEGNVGLLVDNLVYVESVDHRVERILEHVSQSSVSEVFRFFDLRISYRAKGDEGLSGKYEDIPFGLYSINKVLAEHPDELLDLIKKHYEHEYGVCQYGVVSLFKKCFSIFQPQLVDLILDDLDLAVDADFELVLSIVMSYEGCPSILPLVKRVLTEIDYEHDRIVGINAALLSTGVVHGEYGFAEAYKDKLDAISPWLNDQNVNVVKFAYQYSDVLKKMIEEETQRVDEQVAIEKHRYGIGDSDS